MTLGITRLTEPFAALVTCVGFLSGVDAEMLLEVCLAGECLATVCTCEGLLSTVCTHVRHKLAVTLAAQATYVTHKVAL